LGKDNILVMEVLQVYIFSMHFIELHSMTNRLKF